MTTPGENSKFTLKRGGTFELTCRLKPQGGIKTLSGVTVASAVRTANASLYNCTVTIPDPAGTSFTVSIPNSTTVQFWLGPAYWDIKFIKDGKTFYSETVEFFVERNITP